MKLSLNERLLSLPLFQLTFITPFPKEEIFYREVKKNISNEWFEKPTLLTLQSKKEWIKLGKSEVAYQLTQDQHLLGIIIAEKNKVFINENILALYRDLQIPIIQVGDKSLLSSFTQEEISPYHYGQLSLELSGFSERGFINIASNLSTAFSTPLLFLDGNSQLLWQTGEEEGVRDSLQWLKMTQEDAEDVTKATQGMANLTPTPSVLKDSYQQHTMNITGQVKLYLVTSSHLVHWQRQFIDKFIGLTAVVFQTDEVLREQNDRFKEFFIYELLYRKFESKRVLVKQGKAWGWSLEKAHHLLVIHYEEPEGMMANIDWMDELVLLLETKKEELQHHLIVFPFQDQIVVLLEDDKKRLPSDRKNFVMHFAKWLENVIMGHLPMNQMKIGIGKWYSDTIYLNKSYQEAKIALQFGSTWYENRYIVYINDIGVQHLLSHVHRDILQDFCEEYLYHLIESDEKNDTEYIKTLKKYVLHQGVITDVSKALYIHPNTLRNRIKKIEEITGVNSNNLDEFMNLMAAVKVYYSFFYYN